MKLKMGRHKEWRKIAKRERRRRVRTQIAKERDSAADSTSADYQNWLKEQEELELFELDQINKTNMEENEKWLKAEIIAMEQWRRLEEQKEKLRLQHLEEEAKRRTEWDLEQERHRKEKERLREIEEENKKKQEEFFKNLEMFLSGDSNEPPQELLVSRETKADCDPCPFFIKTACCRFGDQCSRNHRYPGISKVLLAANFFTHLGLEIADEHDVDIMLEYEDNDTYREFKTFFFDVLPEFEKFGRITQFKVCNNYEKHLRGNTYVEFAELRCAVAAYRALHTRWYGGKQLSLQFCLINSWKNALCGLQSRKRCPKGRTCNFLHVFRNPNNLFNAIRENQEQADRSRRTSLRTWRWSESPEVEISRRRSRSRSNERRETKRERDKQESSRKVHRHRSYTSRRESRRERDKRHQRMDCGHDKTHMQEDSRSKRENRRGDSQREGIDTTSKNSPEEINTNDRR